MKRLDINHTPIIEGHVVRVINGTPNLADKTGKVTRVGALGSNLGVIVKLSENEWSEFMESEASLEVIGHVDLENYPRHPEEVKAPPKKETVNHPDHYNMARVECIDIIADLDMNFNQGNALKYLWRAKHKGNELEDLKKAAFYIKYEIDRLEMAKMEEEGEDGG